MLLMILFSENVFAASGSVGATLFYQSFNFFLFLGILIYLVKNPYKKFLIKREKDFEEKKNAAQAQLEKALTEKNYWKNRHQEILKEENLITIKAEQRNEDLKKSFEKDLQDLTKTQDHYIKNQTIDLSKRIKHEIIQKFNKQLTQEAISFFETKATDSKFQETLQKKFLNNMERLA